LGDVNMGLYALNLKKHGVRGVFVPVVDDIAMLLAEYAPLLRKNGLSFLTPHPSQLEMCDTYALQQWQGALQVPQTAYCASEDMLHVAKSMGFPVIIKSFRDGFVQFDDEKSMQQWLADAEKHGYPLHIQQRVQQYIPGKVSKMATVLLLFDAQSRPIRGFTARRLRVAATQYGDFGETLAAQAEWIPDLYAAATALLSALNWVGFAEVECKQSDDGQWYLLEINPRLSGWSCLAEADGAAFLQAYYHVNTEDTALEPACLQRSQTNYSRMIASSRHEADWQNYNLSTYNMMRKHNPNQCYGAWDKDDPAANWSWVKVMMKRYFKKL